MRRCCCLCWHRSHCSSLCSCSSRTCPRCVKRLVSNDAHNSAQASVHLLAWKAKTTPLQAASVAGAAAQGVTIAGAAAQAATIASAVSAAVNTPLSLSSVVSGASQLSSLGAAALASLTGSSVSLAGTANSVCARACWLWCSGSYQKHMQRVCLVWGGRHCRRSLDEMLMQKASNCIRG